MKRNSSLTVSSADLRRRSHPASPRQPAARSGAERANAAYWRPPDGLTARIEVCHEGEDVPVRVFGVVGRRTIPELRARQDPRRGLGIRESRRHPLLVLESARSGRPQPDRQRVLGKQAALLEVQRGRARQAQSGAQGAGARHCGRGRPGDGGESRQDPGRQVRSAGRDRQVQRRRHQGQRGPVQRRRAHGPVVRHHQLALRRHDDRGAGVVGSRGRGRQVGWGVPQRHQPEPGH